MLVTDKFEGEPFAVGRPGIVESAGETIPLASICYLTSLLGVAVVDHQLDTILDEGDLLAVGRELRISTVDCFGGQQCLLLNQRGVGEIGILITGDLGGVKVIVAVALAGVDQRAVVRSERETALRLGRMSDLFGCPIFDRGDENLASYDKGYLLAIG